ncbi:hypothetical protein F5J12DRAFT_784214 [Pisolithus orientalis]|uniref:uncharacterized protein n=1 Tax=Pisolithus orientalis TaxID=936130 RepID=UPI0022245E0C|nr:uncharacterized protein F5J12DRAFT_784214 [Pisolithus orientalis]KAI6000965.1 hypothetical protein F5J12DRAFT_784214 [Pisolithus orientalis]
MASSDHSTNCVNTSDEDFSSNEESSLDSMETTKSVPGKLRLDELQILQDGLNDWKEADTNKRAPLMEDMWNKIKWLDANKSLKQNEWNRKQTAIKNWMYNNSWSWAWKALVKYGSKWTALKVIKLQCKKDIQQVLVKARIHPRTSAMIKHYQPAIQKVVQSLTKAELDQAACLAKEWNKRKLPLKAQAEAATSKGQKNDFNDKLGNGELYLDWEDLHGKWSAYTKKAFGANGMEDDSREDEAGQTTVKAWKGKSLACGKMNASVPWAAIADNWASYVSSKYLPPNILFKEPTRLTHHELIETLEFWKEQQQEHPEDVFQFQRWRSQDGSLEEPVAKHQCQSDKAKGKRPWTEVNSIDGSDYGHHSEEEPAPPTKPSTKWQWIDDHPTGTSNAQEDNRQWNQSTSDQHNMATAYPKPADNHANDGGDSTARKPKPKPRIRSDGVDPVGRNLNARPRGHVMDREDRLLDQAEEDGVAHFPEQNCRPQQQPDDNYPTPTMRSQFVHFSNSIQHNLVWLKMVAYTCWLFLQKICCQNLELLDLCLVCGVSTPSCMANSWETAKSSKCDNGIGTGDGDLASGINAELNDAGASERSIGLTGGDWNGGGNPQGGLCNGIPGATGSGDLSHASSSNGVLSERHVDMESQGGSTNGLLEEGDSANDSHAGSIKGDLGKPEDWKEGSIPVVHIV